MLSETQSLADARSGLDRFLADNPELEELSARLARFNVFRVLRIEQTEIRHTNVLAWLLDPTGSHGLGRTVLRRVLSSILLAAKAPVDGVSAARVELMDFSDVEIRREWRHIDLMVICHDENDRMVLLIENKLKSREHSNQLQRYIAIARTEFRDYSIVPVYLTLNSDSPPPDAAQSAYIPWSHAELLQTLELVMQQRRDQLTLNVAAFLDDYLGTLRSVTMQDRELIELCRSIYRKHREAIDLIIEYGRDSVATSTILSVVDSDGRLQRNSPASTTRFALKSIAEIVPAKSVVMNIWSERDKGSRKDRISLAMEVCVKDKDLRLRLARELKAAGFRLSKRALTPDAQSSIFWRKNRDVDLDDPDCIRTELEALLEEASPYFEKLEQVCRAVFGQQRDSQG